MSAAIMVTARYAQDADQVFDLISKLEDMQDIGRGLIAYSGLGSGHMIAGDAKDATVKLFGFWDVGRHLVRFDRVCPNVRRIETRERNRLVRSWHLSQQVKCIGDGALVTDCLVVDARRLTPLVAVVARSILTLRHRNRGALSVAAKFCNTSRQPEFRFPLFTPAE